MNNCIYNTPSNNSIVNQIEDHIELHSLLQSHCIESVLGGLI